MFLIQEEFVMPNNIIEISTDNKKLSVFRGFLRVEEEGNVVKDIPFNSIHALIISGHSVVYTQNLMQRLCEENIPLIILGKNYAPVGMLLSYIGQSKQMEIQHLQMENKKPLEKRIWQQLVQEKIKNQAEVLNLYHIDNPLKNIANEVLSSDSSHCEGYAARIYFKLLFGDDFIRNRDAEGLNAFLNYGYAILRSALSRYVVAAGLNPSYGVGHKNKLNPFCLVDDLIEPFRPVVDNSVYKIFQTDAPKELLPIHKAALSGLLTTEYFNGSGYSPFYMILQHIVWDLVNIYKTKEINFQFNKYLFSGK